MGLKAEFNWYIVLKKKNLLEDTAERYIVEKDDYRIYPMDAPLPIIFEGKCLALGSVKDLRWAEGYTQLIIEPILAFEYGDPVAKYYEDSFSTYKQEQEKINDGGKVRLTELVNLRQRKRL